MTEATKKENPIVKYFQDFGVLKETGREYWGIQLINILDSTIFFAILIIAVVMLSEDFGFNDKDAGYIITLYGSTTTLFLFFSGAITDWLGIKKSFIVAMVGLLITRGAIVFAAYNPEMAYRKIVVIASFGLMAPFVAMVITIFQAANKRFTTKKSRSAGFNLWYLFMNVGAAAGGYLIDVVRLHLKWANVQIFTLGCASAVACIIIAFAFIRHEEQIYGPDEAEQQAKDEEKAKEPKKKPWEIFKEVLAHSVFWKFVVLITILLGVRAVFLYMNLLMPKFWLRTIGPNAQIGLLSTINPILVIVGLILLIPILHRFDLFKMLVYGSMISAISLFFMAIPGYHEQVFWLSILSLSVLTVGEVIWSPRLSEYTAAIAPEGQEGTYLGLSMVPYFLAKTLVGLASGHMLARWVTEFPKGEPIIGDRLMLGEMSFWQGPSSMWVILGILAISGPIIALLFKGWFTEGLEEKKKKTQSEDNDDNEAEEAAEAAS